MYLKVCVVRILFVTVHLEKPSATLLPFSYPTIAASSPDNIPNAVWIWDIRKLKLSVVLEQLCTIQCFQWDPCQPRLAVCTGTNRMYLWSPAGCVAVRVPGEGEALQQLPKPLSNCSVTKYYSIYKLIYGNSSGVFLELLKDGCFHPGKKRSS